jgi:hypothetical protein
MVQHTVTDSLVLQSSNLNFKSFQKLLDTLHFSEIYKLAFENVTCNISTSLLLYKFATFLHLKGQSHEKVGEMSVWGISLGPN